MYRINRSFTLGFVPLTLVAAAFAAACSSDQNGGSGTDAGPDATASGGKSSSTGGSSGAGGSAGKSTGGTPASGGTGGGSGGKAQADAGTPDASATDGGEADAQVDAGPGPEAVLCADAGATKSPLLVGGTAFCMTCSTSEVAAIDREHGCVLGRSTFADSDTVPRVSGGQGFVVQRTKGVLSVVSETAQVTSNVDLNGERMDGGTAVNPHDVVYVAPNGGAAKAYVSLYGASAIAVVDLTNGEVTSRVDLSSLHDPSDSDGSSDPDVGFYDATTGHVYFVVQRIDIFSGTAPDYTIKCPPVPSVLVAIDPATDKVVDLNGAADGFALPLSFVSPGAVAVDTTGHRAIVMSSGCADTTGKRVKAGFEAVDLSALTVGTLLTSTAGYLSGFTLTTPNSAVVWSYDDNFALHYNLWGTTSTELGAELTGVPDNPVAESSTDLLGVVFEAEPRVKRFHITPKTTTTIVSSPWAGKFTASTDNALFP